MASTNRKTAARRSRSYARPDVPGLFGEDGELSDSAKHTLVNLKIVDDLPDNGKTKKGKYLNWDVVTAVAEANRGKWVRVKKYKTPHVAGVVASQIRRRLPKHFQVQTREAVLFVCAA